MQYTNFSDLVYFYVISFEIEKFQKNRDLLKSTPNKFPFDEYLNKAKSNLQSNRFYNIEIPTGNELFKKLKIPSMKRIFDEQTLCSWIKLECFTNVHYPYIFACKVPFCCLFCN